MFFLQKKYQMPTSKKTDSCWKLHSSQKGTCYYKVILPRANAGPEGLFPTKPEHGLIQPYTVTATLIQLAHLMGCSLIYLIGCDTDYHPQDKTKQVSTERISGTTIYQANHNNDPNHFDPAYFGSGKRYQDPKVDKMIIQYEAIKKVSSRLGISIYNAGFSSKLEVFLRIGFEQLSKRWI